MDSPFERSTSPTEPPSSDTNPRPGADAAASPDAPDAPDAEASAAAPGEVSEAQVAEALDRLRPYIQADGGDIELVRIEGHVVFVRVYGACVTCGALDMTMTHGVQSLLREEIDPRIEVEQLL